MRMFRTTQSSAPRPRPPAVCDDRDLSCLRIPVHLSDTCGPIYAPAPEVVFPPPRTDSTSSSGGGGGGSGGGSSSSSGGGSSTGAIVGGVVGGVCGALVIAALAACLVWSRRRKQERIESAEKPSQRPFMADVRCAWLGGRYRSLVLPAFLQPPRCRSQ